MWSRERLISNLKKVGLVRTPLLERALRGVRQEAFLPSRFRPLAYADMPLPGAVDLRGPALPSVRCLVAALDLLEAAPEARILIVGARVSYAAALLAKIAPPDRIVLVEPEEGLRRQAEGRLSQAGFAEVRVLAGIPEEPFDRILTLDPRGPSLRELSASLADLGFLISRGRGVHDLAFVKVVRNGADTVQMNFNEAPSSVLGEGGDGEGAGILDFGRLLAIEDLLVHAWEGRVTGHYDQHFRDVAEETFRGGPMDPAKGLSAREPEKTAARRSFQAAYILQSAGELERAADAYERSLRLAPSAEAHTFLGWAQSFLGRYKDAIAECKKAIAIDASFGNPYNDIGAYLIEEGRLDEAIPWLEKAIASPRYCCYYYGHTNLARVYLQKGMRERARKSLVAALQSNPDYEPARELLRRLDARPSYFR
ncbi:MAG TPA: tetratricopeptide repeat protein [Thermoplasmata archaeon]|jgi:protein-L-isoaspartate O-methyltransferase